MHYAPKTSPFRRRGTALVLMVIISVVLTGLVMTIAWSGGVQAQIASASIRTDQAYMAAESAGQWAVWQFKQNNSWRQTTLPGTLPTITIGPNTFKYGVTCVDAGAAADLYWPFSEGSGTTTADTSGHGNTGQLIGGVSWTTQGKFGDALVFDGVSGYVDAGNNSSTNIVGSMTMAAWVKMNSAGNDQKVGGNQDGTSGGYKMSIYGLNAEFEVRDASNTAWLNRSVAGGTTLCMNNWYHVAGVFNTTTGTISTYINGALDRSLSGVPATALASTTGNFRMGREPWNGSGTRFFNGTLDDVRVYKRALSAQEIQMLADTSVHIHANATLQTSTTAAAPTNAVDFYCSSPTPQAPVAPALTVGGNLPVTKSTISGDVQVTGTITGVSASSVTGRVTYAGGYSDSHSYITITYKGKSATPVQNTAITIPTINYSAIQALAPVTGTSGTGKTYQFPIYYDGTIPIIYVNGSVTDPVIDTSLSTGTLLINGTLTLTKSATFGSSNNPAYVVVQGNISHTGGTMTLYGGLYASGNWTHRDCAINGDVMIGGNVTDNTATASTYVVGGIPWFDPRANVTPALQPLYYTDYQGAVP